MKKSLFLLLSISCNVWAEHRILLKDEKWMNADINTSTVICSPKGYASDELKINIKALDGWTLLDHSNLRFGSRSSLPCMTAGSCKGVSSETGFSIDDVLKNNPRTEKILVKREVIESRYLEVRNSVKYCSRSLTEKLDTLVAGIPFHHQRTIVTGEDLRLGDELSESECLNKI
jgi:hypothetical protein